MDSAKPEKIMFVLNGIGGHRKENSPYLCKLKKDKTITR